MSESELWPIQVREAAEAVFGGAIHNIHSRTHQTLDRRIQHCIRQWKHRYDWTPEQAEYAGDVIAHVITQAAKDAADMKATYAFVLTRLDRLVNNERVHDGMQRRSGRIDISEYLEASLGTAS